MPKFKVTVADEAGHKLYDETIEAEGPREACRIAAKESATAEAPDHLGGPAAGLAATMNDLVIDGSR